MELTSLLRARIPKPVWRRTHFLSFPLFGMATLHGLLAGADAGGLLWPVMLVTTLVVAGLTALRVIQARSPTRPVPSTLPTIQGVDLRPWPSRRR